jgi:hypothetical protein
MVAQLSGSAPVQAHCDREERGARHRLLHRTRFPSTQHGDTSDENIARRRSPVSSHL